MQAIRGIVVDKLTGEEFIFLQEALGNAILMSALRRIFKGEEIAKLEAMRAEAMGHGRASQIVMYAAESRVYAELEATIKDRMGRLAPQSR